MKNRLFAKCIYCKLDKVLTNEHVVSKGLNGNLTIPLVCEDCNVKRLSPLDQSLCNDGFVALDRLEFQEGAFLATSGLYHLDDKPIEVRVGHRFKTKVTTSISFDFNSSPIGFEVLAESPDEVDAFLAKLYEILQREDSKKLPILRGLGSYKSSFPRIVKHRSSSFGFKPSSPDADADVEYNRTVSFLKNNFQKVKEVIAKNIRDVTPSVVEKPRVEMRLSFDFARNYRAVAKTAFNFLAHYFGAELMLRNEFDEIRDFILNGNPPLDEYQRHKLVAWMPTSQVDGSRYSVEGHHTILLTRALNMRAVMINYYNAQTYLVFFNDQNILFDNEHFPIVHLFNFKEKTNRQLHPEQFTELNLFKQFPRQDV